MDKYWQSYQQRRVREKQPFKKFTPMRVVLARVEDLINDDRSILLVGSGSGLIALATVEFIKKHCEKKTGRKFSLTESAT